MTPQTWNARLAEAMGDKNVSLAELSAAVGAAHTSVMAWLGSGAVKPAADIRSSYALRACEFLDIRIEWLILGKLPKRRTEEWPFTTPLDVIERVPPDGKRLIDQVLFLLAGHLAGPPNPTNP
jgi:hypothetical protein